MGVPTRLVGFFLLLSCLAASPSGEAVTLPEALTSAHFAEPLVATAPTAADEDQSLANAISSSDRDHASALNTFLAQYPKSGWAASILTNQGLSALHDGHFSIAIAKWKGAWELGRKSNEPQARAVVDRAVGELSRLYVALGQLGAAKALLNDIGDRPVTGSATESIQTVRDTLALVGRDKAHLYNCGPTALRYLIQTLTPDDKSSALLPFAPVGPQGLSMADLIRLAGSKGFDAKVVKRQEGQPVPIPSVIHWKLGHYGTVTAQANGRFRIEDPAFPGGELWVTQDGLDSESSGYFLVAATLPGSSVWTTASASEMAEIRGKGQTSGTQAGASGARDQAVGGSDPNCGMCGAAIRESTVGITLSDTPVGYAPPIGPAAMVTLTYNQREDSQPANFNFFNVSPKWTLNWLSYVTDDPTNPGGSVSRFLPGGGAYSYSGYNSSSQTFSPDSDDGSVLALTSTSPVVYKRLKQDGSIEVFSQSDGALAYPRRVFLTQKIDPQGNAVNLNYDGQNRLVGLTDAVGRTTGFAYGITTSTQWLVTKITDPFGRSATLAYDSNGRLVSITDVLGITSGFTYDSNGLISSLTTPYGTSTFAYTAPGTSGAPRFADITDPMGFHRRVEWLEPAPISDSDPAATVPTGMSTTNQYLTYRDSFYWDPAAYVAAGCTVSGGCDYTKARDTHYLHVANSSIKSTVPESVKQPLENRIWFNYSGQSSSIFTGSYNIPTMAGRVLDDGSTQLRQYAYDTMGSYKPTLAVDPVGRTTGYAYANHVDLAAIAQGTGFGFQTTLAQFAYNVQHLPVLSTDAAGQTSSITYNTAGQVISLTNPLAQQTQYQYSTRGDLVAVINANGAVAASYTYDAFDRIATAADSEGWTVSYRYDAFDRITRVTYPDGTSESNTYQNLDQITHTDRLGRTWTYAYDADRRRISVADPAGQLTQYAYDPSGRLTALTDPKSNVTQWAYDVQGRLLTKTYPDNSAVASAYETTTSRVKSITDALGQVKQYTYAKDDLPTAITYLNAVNPTPNVSFTYDPYFRRVSSMIDGTGTTTYSYVPVGSLGALQMQQETNSLPGASIVYAYDAVGRLTSRTVSGIATETFGYDKIDRLISHASALGTFNFTYLGQTHQLANRSLVGSTVSTSWSYLANVGDRRLAGIDTVGLSSGQTSNYRYTTTPENFITSVSETEDSGKVPTPTPTSQNATYNNLNQLTTLSGQSLSWDANGNLLSDGQRTYTWDAENRLIGVGYPGQSGKITAFSYDGIGRRVAITSTPAGGGSSATTLYIWCGLSLCESMNSNGAVRRGYYAEGELVAGTPIYYGVDQLNSVRRAFTSSNSAPAYSYDPNGNQLETTAQVTDFSYASLINDQESGLYLAAFRAYDPVVGRWLSRDPILESGGMNLYAYAKGNPLSYVDPDGLASYSGQTPPSNIPGGPWNPAGSGQKPGTFYGPPKTGGRDICRYVPDGKNGGPAGANDSYWKAKSPNSSWVRYDLNGNPITPDEAQRWPRKIGQRDKWNDRGLSQR
ncbi:MULTISPECIES: RHS repeat-associated core domain-containing protein [unclassified Paraburkholderia]|uniref:RHS repeat-associated core domain-containing protein n=1 Tax=unclassified Paraburkholderia TaxID=2615204 RepID=UPI002AB2D045|nr:MULTISPECIES: RHS repeat-associated core domain-containing protein [unclassified Paraburkholderia]